MWNDLRRHARRHRLAPPRPRDRCQLLQSFTRPALTEGAARHSTHFAHLTRTRSNEVSRPTPTAPQPNSGLPPGAEAAVHVWRSET
eukprot:778869-Alexandrium_andersonii.AAC.1